MKKLAAGFALLTGLTFFLIPRANADLATLFQEELQPAGTRPALSEDLKQQVGAMPSVLVAGVLGEVLPGYFSYNADSLKSDFGQTQVTILTPDSCAAEAGNAAKLNADFRSASAAAGGLPLLVLAHSKGGAETMLAILQDPSLISDGIIDRVVLIAGAVGGSAVAQMHTIPGGEVFCPGIEDLRRDQSQATFSAALAALNDNDRNLLSQRIFYVRTEKPTADVDIIFKESSAYLTKNFGPNDGMMLPGDELLPNFGTDLGILTADHSDLVGWGPYTGTPPEFKEAFTRALMRELFGS